MKETCRLCAGKMDFLNAFFRNSEGYRETISSSRAIMFCVECGTMRAVVIKKEEIPSDGKSFSPVAK